MTPPETQRAYAEKTAQYFAGARQRFVDDLPENPTGRLLEIGCGNGDTAVYALQTRRCGWAAGIELCADPAAEAAKRLHSVHCGDVEQMDLPYPEAYFDTLIMSEVVEHLRDPWAAIRKLVRVLKPGASVVSGSPNASHHYVVRMLLRGRFDYAPVGIMDRTHLRWFTPATYRELFEACGVDVLSSGPAAPLRTKARWFNRLTAGRFQHLLHSQIYLRGSKRR